MYQKILLLSQLTDTYLIGTCGVPDSSHPGKQGRGWSTAAGTCSCHLAKSVCAQLKASSHSAGPCRETGSACHLWSGDQPMGKGTVRKEDVMGWKEEKCPEMLATAIAISMARWACTLSVCKGCTNGSTRKLYPSFCIVNKLSHRMNHKNRSSNTVVINHDYFRGMQRRHHASRPAKVTCFA